MQEQGSASRTRKDKNKDKEKEYIPESTGVLGANENFEGGGGGENGK